MSEKIMVVDDEQVILDLASMVLASRGYAVETVSSGIASLDRAKSFRPELILLDYMMPDMDGMSVLRQMRERFPDSYVVMFTGKGSEELAVELMKAGASDYIRKPFNNQDLVDRIENVLRIRRIEIRNRELLEERERLLEEIAGWNCELERRVADKSRELERAQSEIIQAEKLGALGQISAGMAHEIRNPLNSISLFSQVLKQRLHGDNELTGYADKILGEIERIDDLLVRLLSVSDSSLRDATDVALPDVIIEVVSEFRDQFKLQNVELDVKIPENVPMVRANEDDIRQIFSNLIANSLYEMPKGGTFFIFLDFDETRIHIRVCDTGQGIPEACLNKIFDPFFTTKPKGTGFGLSSVLRIVKDCNGRVVAGNRAGGGAVFDIEFPLRKD